MAEQIVDGTGSAYKAKVSDENSIQADANVQDQATHVSQKHAKLYSWTTTHDAGAGEFVLCLRNNDPNYALCIETIRATSDVATNYEIGFGTWATVGGGAEIVGANANKTTSNVALATCHITATNFTADTTPFLRGVASANSERTYRPEGKIVLGYQDTIYIKTSAASTTYTCAVIWGFYKEI